MLRNVREENEPLSHVQNIARVRVTLVESIRRVDRLVAALYQERHLDGQERQRITSQSNLFDKVQQLLDIISAKSLEAYQCLIRALKCTNQEHLSDLLTNAGCHHSEKSKFVTPMLIH